MFTPTITNLKFKLAAGNEEINFSITQEEILRCIKKLKNNKACGEDYVVNEYIKSFI
jgi:hypothetical protein